MKLLLVIFISTLSLSSFSQTLSPGMAAPALQVSEWVKGRPVESFSKDTTYVVELWATWCGPCKESIPHLTKLAKEYPQIRFVGVAVAEMDTRHVAPFVERMGSQMNYNVAIDKQQSATARDGYVTTYWLVAAGLNSIPATFVIRNNQVAWIGHPAQLDDVLEKIAANKWDVQAFARKWNRRH